jgi:hypothetical protein
MAGSKSPTQLRRRRIAPWMVSALVVLIPAAPLACGGGEETTEEVISQAEWVGRANRICVKAVKTISPQMNHTYRKHPPETDELLSLFQNLVPVLREVTDEFDAIPAPPGDEPQVAAIVDGGTETADKIEQGITDPGVRQELLAEGLFPKLFKASRAYGVTRCAAATNPFFTSESLHGSAGGGAGSGASAE